MAGSNIAFLKYWGKRDEEQNLPLNPSISMTLDETLSTRTTIEFSEDFEHDSLDLNEIEETGPKLERISRFLNILREKADVSYLAKVVSINTFPTGAGIASSASGFAALAGAGAKALGLEMSDDELSGLARLGSGSAARSIHGGFVEWEDEQATQLFPADHWAHLRDLLVIVSTTEKSIGSTEAMRQTVETSRLFKKRLGKLAARQKGMVQAIKDRDFQKLAPLIIEESDDLHACMKDTIPSIDYLNGVSRQVIERLNGLNHKDFVAAYTFDAGPNAHVICDTHDLSKVRESLNDLQGVQLLVAGLGNGLMHSRRHLF